MQVVEGQLQGPYTCRTCSADFDLTLRVGEEPWMTHQGGRADMGSARFPWALHGQTVLLDPTSLLHVLEEM